MSDLLISAEEILMRNSIGTKDSSAPRGGARKEKKKVSELSTLDQPCWLNKTVSRILFDSFGTKDLGEKRPADLENLLESLLYSFVCRMHGNFPSQKNYMRLIRSVKMTIDRLLQLSPTQRVDFVKYFTTLDAWEVIESIVEPPKRPSFLLETDRLYHGYLKQFVGIAKARKDFSFILSLLASKRFWMKPDFAKCQSTLSGHRAAVKEAIQNGLDEDICEEIYLIVQQQVLKSSVGDCCTSFTPSQSACLQKGVAENGNLGLFNPFCLPDPGEFGRSPFSGRYFPLLPQQISALFHEHCSSELERIKDAAREGGIDNLTRLCCLYEPGGKIRVIGVEDGYYSSFIQPLQGAMLDLWKSDEASTMIDDVDDRVFELFNHSSLPYFLSGDFEQATNTMVKGYSAHGLNAYRQHFQVQPGFLSVKEQLEEFTSCIMMYPRGEKVGEKGKEKFKPYDVPDVSQGNGQRMGSRESFPVLCVVNKACYRAAVRKWVRSLLESGLQCRTVRVLRRAMWKINLINGDDIAAKCTEDFYHIWANCVSKVGWRLSAGKNYLSKRFLQINSRNYVLQSNGCLKRVGYLNLKLVTGFSLKKGESASDPECISTGLNDMVKFCPWSKYAIPKALIRFGSRFKGSFKPNWFIPAHLGGFGLDFDCMIEDDFKKRPFGFSVEQLKVAAQMLADPRQHLTIKIKDKMVNWADLDPKLASFVQPITLLKKGDLWSPGEENEDLVPYRENSVMGRITEMGQWQNAGAPEPKRENKRFLQWNKKWSSVKPLSLKKLFSYWIKRPYVMPIQNFPPKSDLPGFMQKREYSFDDLDPKDIFGRDRVVRDPTELNDLRAKIDLQADFFLNGPDGRHRRFYKPYYPKINSDFIDEQQQLVQSLQNRCVELSPRYHEYLIVKEVMRRFKSFKTIHDWAKAPIINLFWLSGQLEKIPEFNAQKFSDFYCEEVSWHVRGSLERTTIPRHCVLSYWIQNEIRDDVMRLYEEWEDEDPDFDRDSSDESSESFDLGLMYDQESRSLIGRMMDLYCFSDPGDWFIRRIEVPDWDSNGELSDSDLQSVDVDSYFHPMGRVGRIIDSDEPIILPPTEEENRMRDREFLLHRRFIENWKAGVYKDPEFVKIERLHQKIFGELEYHP